MDGATRWQSFRAITLPLITPFTLMVTILLTIASFKTFALIQLMTRAVPVRRRRCSPTTFIRPGPQLFDMGYASAIAVVLFVAVLTLTRSPVGRSTLVGLRRRAGNRRPHVPPALVAVLVLVSCPCSCRWCG